MHKAATAVPAKFTTSSDEATINEILSTGTNLNMFYLNVYRTAPGDEAITRTVTATAIATDGVVLSHTFMVNITSSGMLSEKTEDYSIKVGNTYWEDRDVGQSCPVAESMSMHKILLVQLITHITLNQFLITTLKPLKYQEYI